jgi:hypothetical protein
MPPGRGIQRVNRVWLACAVLVLAGCGGGAKHPVTVSVYGVYPAETVAGKASAAECGSDARAFARDALLLLAHSGADAAYPADLYYVIARGDFADYTDRGCDPRYVGAALRERLTAAQRAALVADLPHVMAQAVSDGLSVTRP